jgi:hypothetical protein
MLPVDLVVVAYGWARQGRKGRAESRAQHKAEVAARDAEHERRKARGLRTQAALHERNGDAAKAQQDREQAERLSAKADAMEADAR